MTSKHERGMYSRVSVKKQIRRAEMSLIQRLTRRLNLQLTTGALKRALNTHKRLLEILDAN